MQHNSYKYFSRHFHMHDVDVPSFTFYVKYNNSGTPLREFSAGFSICSPNDQFSREAGTTMAMHRLAMEDEKFTISGVNIEGEPIIDSFIYALTQKERLASGEDKGFYSQMADVLRNHRLEHYDVRSSQQPKEAEFSLIKSIGRFFGRG